MSLPNDWAVLGGLGILLALLVFYIWAVPKVWKRMSSCIKQIGHPVLLLVVIGSLAMIGCTRIEPGHVGIIINNSGTYRGVEDVPMSTGWVWYNPFSSSVLNYPTYVQQAVWSANVHEGKAINEEIDFNSSDQMRFTADVAVGYSLQEKGVPHFYIKFRSDVLSTFTHGFFRNEARQALNAAADKFSSEEILSTKKDELLNTAREFLASRVTPYGVTIEQFTFTGAPRPPVELTASINAKVSAIQRAQQAENELREATAQAAKAVAKAKGESEANRLLSESLTPTLLEWRKLQITEQAIAKWNGARPMVEGAASGLLLNITPPKE
ncbi:MAG: SPFH domain-containing protein [bacterium]|nr:SPFH domain-containing protein [bacterium]